MKKARFLTFLITLVFASSVLISGTAAKYSTTDAANAKAQAAKWGVVLAVDGTLFGTNYLDGKNGNTPTKSFDSISVSSNSNGTPEVVAPGTQNNVGMLISLTGTPEVKTQVDMTVKTQSIYLKKGTYGVMVKNNAVTEENFAILAQSEDFFIKKLDGSFVKTDVYAPNLYSLKDLVTLSADYFPVLYSAGSSVPAASALIDRHTAVSGTTANDTLAMIAKAYVEAVGGTITSTSVSTGDDANKTVFTASNIFPANKNLNELRLSDERISWTWNYTEDGRNGANDKADTILGNLIAGKINGVVVKLDESAATTTYAAPEAITDYNLYTTFELEITVTQLD